MAPIINFLSAKKTPLLVNVYPYFAYSSVPKNVRLDCALFEFNSIMVQDGSLGYRRTAPWDTRTFLTLLSIQFTQLWRKQEESVEVAVFETGRPSDGGEIGATMENARKYKNNVVLHVGAGSETYLFAMFNEDLKPAGTEQNFGLYHPDI